MKKMMYVHGFMSGANGAKQKQLQKMFEGRYEVIAPELDGNPDKSLAILNDVIRKEKPEVIVGTSLGGWMTVMCDSGEAKLILVNPCTDPTSEIDHLKDQPLNTFANGWTVPRPISLRRKLSTFTRNMISRKPWPRG